jgi:RimJ/RimL family protein N-acetyltransferase
MIHLLEKIESARLVLRPLETGDAGDIQRLAGDYEVARWAENVPHPYEDGEAEKFIDHSTERYRRNEAYTFAIVERESNGFIGTIDIRLEGQNKGDGEIGYWIGREFQGKGYATEATKSLLAFAVDHLQLERIIANVLEDNAASISVLKKCGMRFKGREKQQRDGSDEPVTSERYAVFAKDIRRHD